MLSNISTNIQNLNDEVEELYLNCIDLNNTNLTAEEKSRIREFKINNKIKDTFLPMMMIMKMILENNTNV